MARDKKQSKKINNQACAKVILFDAIGLFFLTGCMRSELISLISFNIYIEEDKKDTPKNECKTTNKSPTSDVPTPIGSVKTTKFFNHCHALIDNK